MQGSNEQLLGANGWSHPLNTYLYYGVPAAPATDDQGILRTDLSTEYERAITEHGLNYVAVKAMARAALEHSFVQGESLWAERTLGQPVSACDGEEPGAPNPIASCKRYLDGNRRAQLQWQLEGLLTGFEEHYSR